jgi:hypothetical protein
MLRDVNAQDLPSKEGPRSDSRLVILSEGERISHELGSRFSPILYDDGIRKYTLLIRLLNFFVIIQHSFRTT